ncbi:hypothetical protein FGB62_48g067 [Gracilaria domingensis]|nr:hypothetical protein FGB62_48g067 [Gracilaria domingensis]
MGAYVLSFMTPLSMGRNDSISTYGFFPGVCLRSRNSCRLSQLRQHGAHIVKATQLDEVESKRSTDESSSIPYVKLERFTTAVAYVGFVLFAFFLAPGSITDVGEIGRILSGKLDDVNDLFFAIFNLVGVLSINMAVLLNAGSGVQKRLSTGLFSFAGIFVGFGALGPYLLGREYAPCVYSQDVSKGGFFSRLLESRIFSIGTLIFTIWIYAFALGVFTPGTADVHDAMFYASYMSLERLLLTDRSVCVSTLDGLLLSILTLGPLIEDMKRRGWFVNGKMLESVLTAISVVSTPGLGVALYLILRPRLPRKANPS